MTKVITYGTFDMLHHGHVRLLERAKALGNYLIVGITADNFDLSRGKINVSQTLSERIDALKKTGLADKIIVEEYQGQKIDDILKYQVDIFAIGDDWQGYFDFLDPYCKIIYLSRTPGISSSELRQKDTLRLGFYGREHIVRKFIYETGYVNGLTPSCACVIHDGSSDDELPIPTARSFMECCDHSDAIYICGDPQENPALIDYALKHGKHVLCESPMTVDPTTAHKLQHLAKEQGLILMCGVKTAHCIAYQRMLSMVRSGAVGKVVSIDVTCTSLNHLMNSKSLAQFIETGSAFNAWGSTALLPVFQLLGPKYADIHINVAYDPSMTCDHYAKMHFAYDDAIASIFIGKTVKSEGDLRISGTKGYIYVPSPWWKTEYFELRMEDPSLNRRYFYPLNGEGIRLELLYFMKAIKAGQMDDMCLDNEIVTEISKIAGMVHNQVGVGKLRHTPVVPTKHLDITA